MAIKLEITGDNAAEFKTQLSGVAAALLGRVVPARLDAKEEYAVSGNPLFGNVREESAQEQEEAKNTMLDSTPETAEGSKQRKRRTKADIEADKAKEQAGESASSSEVNEDTGEGTESVSDFSSQLSELEVSAGIQECATANDLGNFYHANSQMVDGSEGLMAGFKKKQAELQAKEKAAAQAPAQPKAETPETPEQPATPSDEWPVIDGVKIDAEVLKALAMKKRDKIQARGTQQDAIKTLQPILERHDIRAFSQTPPDKAAAVYAELIALS